MTDRCGVPTRLLGCLYLTRPYLRLRCTVRLPNCCRRMVMRLPADLQPSMQGALIRCVYFVKVGPT